MVKLTPESKRVFLRHSLEFVCNSPQELPRKFFKLLLISKSYLWCSRLYRIYDFNARPRKSDVEIHLKSNTSNISRTIRVSFAQAANLIQLFNPRLSQVTVDGAYTFDEDLGEFGDALSQVKGKVRLSLMRIYRRREDYLPIIQQIHPRLTELECHVDLLANMETIPAMKLHSCTVANIKTTDQLELILRHDMRILNIKFWWQEFEDFEIPPVDDSKKMVSHSIRHMKLHCPCADPEKLIRFIDYIKRSCPNLTTLELKTYQVYQYEMYVPHDFFQLTLKEYGWVQELRKRYQHTFAKFAINFKLTFSLDCNDGLNDAWLVELTGHDAFKKAQLTNEHNDTELSYSAHMVEEGRYFPLEFNVSAVWWDPHSWC